MPPFDFNRLIITDTRNAEEAKKLKASDPRFSDATIVEVHTVDEFIGQLRKTITTGVLVLVFDGDKNGRIEIEGEPLDLNDVTGVKLRVMDDVFLEGTSVKPFAGGSVLKAKVHAGGAFRDEWVVLELPQFDVVVDDDKDDRTHGIDSTAGPDGLMHFVTAKQRGGFVYLRAKLVSGNTAKNKKELKWDAPARYRVLNDQWALKIPRGRTTRVQIPLKFYGKVVKQVVVWVLWCKLTPLWKLDSPLDHRNLGALQPRTTGALEAIADVDWIAVIEPPTITSDADRPDLEHQQKTKVPGENVVPDPFFGWELATDLRMFIKMVTPTGKHVVLQGKTDPDGMYRWPNGDAEGLSAADDHENPYAPAPFYGWPGHWEIEWKDSDAEAAGTISGFHKQARVFERVQLGTRWYRCSEIKRYRFKASARKLPSGEWEQEPDTKPLLEMNNKNW